MKACIQLSSLWPQIVQIKLTTNMRVHEDEVALSSYLLGAGNGDEKVYADIGEHMIQVP